MAAPGVYQDPAPFSSISAIARHAARTAVFWLNPPVD
jgi:hypothetical protein